MNKFDELYGIVYKIENKVNGKVYVGQTIYSFSTRYKGGKWWKYTNNRHLKSSAKKYGENNFDISILEHSKSLEELNALESKYAIEFNSYHPHGYNLNECGNNKKQNEESILLRSRKVWLNDPNGKDVEIHNIRKFCRDNGLDNRCLSRVLSGKFNSHKGWSLKGNKDKFHKNNKRYIIYSLDGRKHEITGLATFCRLNNLDYTQMRDMINKRTKQSQGYALNKDNFKDKKQWDSFKLKHGDDTLEIKNVKEDCPKMGLHPKYIYELLNGRIPHYKGWKVI